MILNRLTLLWCIATAALGEPVSDRLSDESSNLQNGYSRSLSTIIAKERQTLNILYEKCKGKDWYQNGNTDHCDWESVQCNDSGHITKLFLEQQSMSGTIPTELGTLANLQTLDLSSNNLDGQIPSELGGNLPDILMLDLSNNRLNGTIPFELASIGSSNNNPENMKIRLTDNDFGFGQNNLAPYSLCITRKFNFGHDKKVCPPERDYLKDFFSLSNGQEWFNNDNWDNEYTHPCHGDWFGVTCNKGNTSVTKIVLSSNDISGKLSARIGRLESLRVLDLSDNDIMGRIPSAIGGLSSLKKLDLSYNSLRGEIPDEFENIAKNLDTMRLQGNRLKGSITGLLKSGEITRISEKDISKFVADCGYPADLDISCQNCTMCCNSNGECETRYNEDNKIATLFFTQLKEQPTLRFLVLLTLILCACAMLSIISLCILNPPGQHNDNDQHSDNNLYIPSSSRQPKINDQWSLDQNFRTLLGVKATSTTEPNLEHATTYDDDIVTWMGKDSIYILLLGKRRIGWLIAVLIAIAQMLVFWIFYKESMLDFERDDHYDQAWVYKWSCPPNKTTCEKEKLVSWSGWLVFSILMILNLAPDFWNGIRILYLVPKRKTTVEDGDDSTIPGRFIGGFLLVATSVIAFYVSITFNLANAGSNTELIINSAILLFVNTFDELSLKLFQTFFPTWMMMDEGDGHDQVARKKFETLQSNIANNEEITKKELETIRNEILQAVKSIRNNEIESLKNEIRQIS